MSINQGRLLEELKCSTWSLELHLNMPEFMAFRRAQVELPCRCFWSCFCLQTEEDTAEEMTSWWRWRPQTTPVITGSRRRTQESSLWWAQTASPCHCSSSVTATLLLDDRRRRRRWRNDSWWRRSGEKGRASEQKAKRRSPMLSLPKRGADEEGGSSYNTKNRQLQPLVMKAEPKVTNRTETDGDLHVQQQAPKRQQTHSKTEVNSWKRR